MNRTVAAVVATKLWIEVTKCPLQFHDVHRIRDTCIMGTAGSSDQPFNVRVGKGSHFDSLII